MRVYGFRVDEPLLPIEVPLAAGDKIEVDFGAVYKHTFERLSWFHTAVDYAKEPLHFQSYQRPDQQRIWARMLAVVDAKQTGQSLDRGPFPPLKRDSALKMVIDSGYDAAALLVDEQELAVGWLARHPDPANRDQYSLSLIQRILHSERRGGEIEGVILAVLSAELQALEGSYNALKTTFEQGGWQALLDQIERIRR
jgi:hypothetical protein